MSCLAEAITWVAPKGTSSDPLVVLLQHLAAEVGLQLPQPQIAVMHSMRLTEAEDQAVCVLQVSLYACGCWCCI